MYIYMYTCMHTHIGRPAHTQTHTSRRFHVNQYRTCAAEARQELCRVWPAGVFFCWGVLADVTDAIAALGVLGRAAMAFCIKMYSRLLSGMRFFVNAFCLWEHIILPLSPTSIDLIPGGLPNSLVLGSAILSKSEGPLRWAR